MRTRKTRGYHGKPSTKSLINSISKQLSSTIAHKNYNVYVNDNIINVSTKEPELALAILGKRVKNERIKIVSTVRKIY